MGYGLLRAAYPAIRRLSGATVGPFSGDRS
jgi:hypothetical protein